jgi:hypothetical protein
MPAVRLGTSTLYFFQCVTRATAHLAPVYHSAYYGYQSLSDTPTGNNPMRWFKHGGLSALYGRLSGPTPDPERMAHRVEDIRVAMLDMLGELGEQTYPQVARRIRYGGDALGPVVCARRPDGPRWPDCTVSSWPAPAWSACWCCSKVRCPKAWRRGRQRCRVSDPLPATSFHPSIPNLFEPAALGAQCRCPHSSSASLPSTSACTGWPTGSSTLVGTWPNGSPVSTGALSCARSQSTTLASE